MSDNPYASPVHAQPVRVLEAKCARGFVIGGWQDEFSFAVPTDENILHKIQQFYECHGARQIRTGVPIEFVRGNRLWSLVGLCSERRLLQRIRVNLEIGGPLTRVKVLYRVFVSLGIRMPPFQFSPEAAALADQLQAIADPSQSQ